MYRISSFNFSPFKNNCNVYRSVSTSLNRTQVLQHHHSMDSFSSKHSICSFTFLTVRMPPLFMHSVKSIRTFTRSPLMDSENSGNPQEITINNTDSELFKDGKWYCNYDPATEAQNVYGSIPSYMEDTPEDQTDSFHVDSSKEEVTGESLKKQKKKKTYKKNVEMEKGEKHQYFTRSLKSYVQVCGTVNMNNEAHECVLYYRYKNEVSKRDTSINIDVYNALLSCWAAVGDLERFKETISYMVEDNITPNLQTYAVNLECLARCRNCPQSEIDAKIEEIAEALKKKGKSLSSLFQECVFSKDQMEQIEKVLRPKYYVPLTADPYACRIPYTCKLLEKLNDPEYEKSPVSPHIIRSISKNDIRKLTSEQMHIENEFYVTVKSINSSKQQDQKTINAEKCVKKWESIFHQQLSSALDMRMENLYKESKRKRIMGIYPYLEAVGRTALVNILLQEIRWLIEGAEDYSPSLKILCQNMGHKVMNHYFISMRKENKVVDKISLIYSKYLEYLLTPELSTSFSPRQYWEFLKHLHCKGPTVDIANEAWPHHIIYEVGKFMYHMILWNMLFDINNLGKKTRQSIIMRPFFVLNERSLKAEAEKQKYKFSMQIRPHPKLCQLYKDANITDLLFDVTMVPMVSPPRPWMSMHAGGLLTTSVPFVRLPPYPCQYYSTYENVPREKLHPCFDSLNSLSLCPWIINKPVLDLIIEVFRNGGCEELDVPINPQSFKEPEITKEMSDLEKTDVYRQKYSIRKKKKEATSLWFDCLYKLSIANQFRDRIFWFPHNIDFRGRVYPTPPHFNHLGSDLVRSILLFAEGKPLGRKGLDWLKIHLINLTGFKKREPNSERLRYANEVMPEILDSADNPFTGNKWWQTSDEPWQTLACCMEVARVLRSADPVNYISHYPIHQDGSCNGLQHYAALGRDEYGAKEVNLHPADRPQDVYSGVAALVEEQRVKDAAKGNEVAIVLEGHIKRKVVKQTVMTFVYGVTEYGAKQQIQKQLKDLPDFPKNQCNSAARYLMKLTFASICKMFTATREIQKWFTDCAEVITRNTEEPVEWVTPLGLPVVQPYHKKTAIRALTNITTNSISMYSENYDNSSYISTYEKFQLPNVRKQKNAFPPNFIHSLDSSHMMLTSLFCQRRGVTFVSVHDCFWTHAMDVDIMNQICRQQFVALHSEPILEDLSAFFIKKYCQTSLNKKTTAVPESWKSVLGHVPKKGTFNLNCVLDSVYFFS